MDVAVRDQNLDKLVVTEQVAFGVSKELVTDDIENEITELCRLLTTIHAKTNWANTRDLLTEITGFLHVYDERTGKTL